MTEKELRERLVQLTNEIPDETHRAFLSAASPGKEGIMMKKKISFGLVIAILISLMAIALAANELNRGFSVDWQGETDSESEETVDDIADLNDTLRKMRTVLSTVPDDVYAVVEWDGEPSNLTHQRKKRFTATDEIDHPGIVFPDYITTQDTLEVEATYGCLAGGKYILMKEEIIDGFTLKQYTYDPSFEVMAEYLVQYMDENRFWHSIRTQLSTTQNNIFRFETMEGEDYSAEVVEIPGIDHAIFVTRGINKSLFATRTLDHSVVLVPGPGRYPQAEEVEYQYELIEMNGFTLEECLSLFGAD